GALSNRGCENVDIFATEHAAFACVRVNRRYSQALRPKLCVYEPNKPHVLIRRDLCKRVMQREMDGRQDDFESRCEEPHAILPHLCVVGKKIRLPMKVAANGFFVYGGCDNPFELSGEGR